MSPDQHKAFFKRVESLNPGGQITFREKKMFDDGIGHDIQITQWATEAGKADASQKLQQAYALLGQGKITPEQFQTVKAQNMVAQGKIDELMFQTTAKDFLADPKVQARLAEDPIRAFQINAAISTGNQKEFNDAINEDTKLRAAKADKDAALINAKAIAAGNNAATMGAAALRAGASGAKAADTKAEKAQKAEEARLVNYITDAQQRADLLVRRIDKLPDGDPNKRVLEESLDNWTTQLNAAQKTLNHVRAGGRADWGKTSAAPAVTTATGAIPPAAKPAGVATAPSNIVVGPDGQSYQLTPEYVPRPAEPVAPADTPSASGVTIIRNQADLPRALKEQAEKYAAKNAKDIADRKAAEAKNAAEWTKTKEEIKKRIKLAPEGFSQAEWEKLPPGQQASILEQIQERATRGGGRGMGGATAPSLNVPDGRPGGT